MKRDENIKLRHRQMLALQRDIKPFTPTIRELMVTWDYKTLSAVHYMLQQLHVRGLVVTRAAGTYLRYFAVRAKRP